MNARGFNGAAGRRYFYMVDPTLRCPYREGPPLWMDDALAESEATAVAEGDTPLGLDLSRVFRRAHLKGSAVADTDDPTRCRSCGSYLESLGYRVWIEEPWPSEEDLEAEYRQRARTEGWDADRLDRELGAARSSRAVALRLGGSHRLVPGSVAYFATKRGREGAIAWCREQALTHRAAWNADNTATV